MTSGSCPKIWSETGFSSGEVSQSSPVLWLLKVIALALIISMQTSPAPISWHSRRNGRSETPAIGAKTTLLGIVTFPI